MDDLGTKTILVTDMYSDMYSELPIIRTGHINVSTHIFEIIQFVYLKIEENVR